jgi:hypothetical protein
MGDRSWISFQPHFEFKILTTHVIYVKLYGKSHCIATLVVHLLVVEQSVDLLFLAHILAVGQNWNISRKVAKNQQFSRLPAYHLYLWYIREFYEVLEGVLHTIPRGGDFSMWWWLRKSNFSFRFSDFVCLYMADVQDLQECRIALVLVNEFSCVLEDGVVVPELGCGLFCWQVREKAGLCIWLEWYR